MFEIPNPGESGPEPRPPSYPPPDPAESPPGRKPDWEPGEEMPPGPVIDPMPDPAKMERVAAADRTRHRQDIGRAPRTRIPPTRSTTWPNGPTFSASSYG